MRKLIVANYKMNGNIDFYKSVAKKLKNIKAEDTKIVLCPPFVYLPYLKIKNKFVEIGAQDVALSVKGKSTGQISANMLKEFGANYTIVGHSERREIGETNEMVATKAFNALECGLTPIVCVGELKKNSALNIVVEQVEHVLKSCNNKGNIVFAYEPVWAIGSGEIPTINRINKVIKLIKETIKNYGLKPICLYGGSVNVSNYKEIEKAEIDGFLLGGVSLDVDKFIEIIKGVDND